MISKHTPYTVGVSQPFTQKTLTMTEKTVNVYQEYETDRSAEEDGAWVELRAGVKVKIRSETSSIVRDYATKLAKTQRNILKANGWVLPPKMSDRNDVLMCKNAIVTDWDGVSDREGNPLPFSPDNVERVMTDLPGFRNDILFVAKTDETYKSVKEDMLGNSSPRSKDSSNTVVEALT